MIAAYAELPHCVPLAITLTAPKVPLRQYFALVRDSASAGEQSESILAGTPEARGAGCLPHVSGVSTKALASSELIGMTEVRLEGGGQPAGSMPVEGCGNGLPEAGAAGVGLSASQSCPPTAPQGPAVDLGDPIEGSGGAAAKASSAETGSGAMQLASAAAAHTRGPAQPPQGPAKRPRGRPLGKKKKPPADAPAAHVPALGPAVHGSPVQIPSAAEAAMERCMLPERSRPAKRRRTGSRSSAMQAATVLQGMANAAAARGALAGSTGGRLLEAASHRRCIISCHWACRFLKGRVSRV